MLITDKPYTLLYIYFGRLLSGCDLVDWGVLFSRRLPSDAANPFPPPLKTGVNEKSTRNVYAVRRDDGWFQKPIFGEYHQEEGMCKWFPKSGGCWNSFSRIKTWLVSGTMPNTSLVDFALVPTSFFLAELPRHHLNTVSCTEVGNISTTCV